MARTSRQHGHRFQVCHDCNSFELTGAYHQSRSMGRAIVAFHGEHPCLFHAEAHRHRHSGTIALAPAPKEHESRRTSLQALKKLLTSYSHVIAVRWTSATSSGESWFRSTDDVPLPTAVEQSSANRASPTSPEKFADVLDEQLRLLERREMTASRHLGELGDVVLRLNPLARHHGEELAREPRAREGHARRVPSTRCRPGSRSTGAPMTDPFRSPSRW